MGDCNYLHVVWTDVLPGHEAETKSLDTINDCFVEQLNSEPQQEKQHLSWSWVQDLVHYVTVQSHTDHRLLALDILCRIYKGKKSYAYFKVA